MFTPYTVLTSALSSEAIQNIFDFNPISLLTGIPLNSSFILPITFWLVRSKKFDWYSLKSSKCLY